MNKLEKLWRTCSKCKDLNPCNHVFYRGRIPCDILFIGEAPGHNEDLCGLPFVGRSGNLLDSLIVEAKHDLDFVHGITNVLCCIPIDKAAKIRPPTREEAKNCRPRLNETIIRTNPSMLCILGTVAKKYTKTMKATRILPTLELAHPAYMLRNGGINSLDYMRSVIYLKEFVEKNYAKKED